MAPRHFWLPGIILCTFLAFAPVLTAQGDKEPAPRFHAKTTSGDNFSNDSIKGKVVLLEFWTTWCGFCAEEAPFVDQLAKEFAGKGLVALAVNVGESKKTVNRYLQLHPRSIPIVLMEDTNLAAMYQATVYPIYVLIDREGNIVGTQRGAAGERALRRLLTRAAIGGDNDSVALGPAPASDVLQGRAGG